MLSFFKNFGDVKYSVIVKNKETNTSKGMGFIHYFKEECVTDVLNKYNNILKNNINNKRKRIYDNNFNTDSNNFILEGRFLNITKNLSKEKIKQINDNPIKDKNNIKDDDIITKDDKGKIRKDLWKYGIIDNLTIENGFKGLTKDEQNKRILAYKEKKENLSKDEHVISFRRIMLKNLPKKVDEKILKNVINNLLDKNKYNRNLIKNIGIKRNKKTKESIG